MRCLLCPNERGLEMGPGEPGPLCSECRGKMEEKIAVVCMCCDRVYWIPKTPHNVTGLFAVMEGASSDLRTGLPRQMIEIHEPLRLQIVVEARIEILTAIYSRQASLRELIGNGWVHLIAKDPDTGEFAVFDPALGFVPWSGPVKPLCPPGLPVAAERCLSHRVERTCPAKSVSPVQETRSIDFRSR